MRSWVILPILVLVSLPLRAESSATNVVGAAPGYVFDVEQEKNQHDVELVLIEPPPPPPSFQAKFFDPKLTKDIREQYELRFGHTALEQTINAPQDRETSYYYNGDTTVGAQQYQADQLSFAQFMERKAIEKQIDGVLQSSPNLKHIYDMKDKFSNASVETKAGYKFNFHYNITGNNVDLEVQNPYHIESKIIVQFQGLTGQLAEETLKLGYKLTPLWKLDSYYKCYDGVAQIVGTRKITKSLSGTITGSTTTTPAGPSVRQTLALVGFSWTQ